MQRVPVVRALVVGPDLLLTDEPTSELDETNRDLVVEELRAEADRGAVVLGVATVIGLVVSRRVYRMSRPATLRWAEQG